MSLRTPAPSTGTSVPASPYGGPTVLILEGCYANHVAQIVQTLPHGGAKVSILWGYTNLHVGKTFVLSQGQYVRTGSPTCPALPPRPRAPATPKQEVAATVTNGG